MNFYNKIQMEDQGKYIFKAQHFSEQFKVLIHSCQECTMNKYKLKFQILNHRTQLKLVLVFFKFLKNNLIPCKIQVIRKLEM